MLKHLFYSLLCLLVLLSCGSSEKQPVKKAPAKKKRNYSQYYNSIVNVRSYDGDRILEKSKGFVIDSNIVVAPLSIFKSANKVVVQPQEGKKAFSTNKFIYIDRLRGVVLLRFDSLKAKPVKFATSLPKRAEKVYTLGTKYKKSLSLKKGLFIGGENIQGAKYYKLTNKLSTSQNGTPVFDTLTHVIGYGFAKHYDYELTTLIIPYYDLQAMAKEENHKPTLLTQMNTESEEQKRLNRKVRGVVVNTDYGKIQIRLFHDMPIYRDNFLKLIREHYYDSLMIHRIIPGFVVQTGAADSRYAGKGDEVGWKGPGYTLPANIHPTKFHQRGMVGCPRLPNDRNTNKRSNGSQFYVVKGRIYNDEELDKIEQQKDIKFTAAQRNKYKTVGGAPTLDHEYTIFGEMVSGMSIIDQLDKVETDHNYRPLKDIRIKSIKILK